MDNNNYDETYIFNFNNVINYIKENFIGLLMLICVFLIIYIVDHINYVNSKLFSTPSPIPIPGIISNNVQNIIKKVKKTKNK